MRHIDWNRALGFPLDAEYREPIEADLSHRLRHAGKINCILILIFELIMMASMAFREGGPFGAPRRQGYFLLYVALFCATLIFLFLGYKRNTPPAKLLRFGSAYALLVCLWSCGVTFLDQFGGNGLNVYIYVILFVSLFAMLKPWQSILIFLTGFVVLNSLLVLTPSGSINVFNNLMNSCFLTIIAIFLSCYFYRSRVFSAYDQIIIGRQYQEISQVNDQLQELVMTDQLTQMKNRRYLEDVVAGHLSQCDSCHPTAGIMIDIDFFKQYNDTYGHQEGDVCLRNIAQVLLEYVDEGAYVVRYGGEEFFICLLGTTEQATAEIAESIRNAVETCKFVREDLSEGHVTVSIGVYWSESAAELTLDEIVRRSDEALYLAKHRGRNRVEYYQSTMEVASL